ncbi:MAG: TIGR01212 family radical SAM protein [Dethiobacteria bacterium]|nr:TIGR01212 family radical SAM protein [Bacillota bacterium]HOP68578.1 TIGR01212 family radical SAM protein [Bacillota bacterium]HPT33341.1 TIGR01212 family radical SAM protein [Bacillota bacterium]HPZ63996.1 TIGR01212 family radical SAM protein [Bacillota bacterium]HQD05290.1 TIGR01212 family radical SAM protein [Bacillota bacterium]
MERFEPGWYYRLSQFFREKFGHPLYKIPLEAGFSCPNRDGTIGRHGCSYCYNPSFSFVSGKEKPLSITEQLRRGKKKGAPGRRYLAYFQTYSNTYAPVEQLERLYSEALQDPDVVGLSISTRPDCVNRQVLELLEGYARKYHVWLEYGLQSSHNTTLERINRGHTFQQFQEAVRMTRGRHIYICAHLILGLPGESPEMMLQTVDRINGCGIDGVKFHQLQVIKGTPLAQQYEEGQFDVFASPEEYLSLLCDCLERLDPGITVHRLAGRVTSRELLLAPAWEESSAETARKVEAELIRRSSWQGRLARKRNRKNFSE